MKKKRSNAYLKILELKGNTGTVKGVNTIRSEDVLRVL